MAEGSCVVYSQCESLSERERQWLKERCYFYQAQPVPTAVLTVDLWPSRSDDHLPEPCTAKTHTTTEL